jgi:glycerophosphoryl diester phosphodiesterase
MKSGTSLSALTLCIVLALMSLPGAIAGADPQKIDPVGPELQRRPKHGVYVVAHRGAHNGIPENTLPAYAKAIELGVDFVEIDVRATKDGKLVSIHNHRIDSYVEGVTGRVGEFTLEELRALDIGKRMGETWIGTRVPTLDEILALCKGKCGVYLDLKEPGLLDEIAETVLRHGMEGDVLWYAPFHFMDRLKVFRDRYPQMILMPDPIQEKRIAALAEGLRPRVMAASWKYYSASFVRACHQVGAIVIVDERDSTSWNDALAWGSDGIQTDHPAALIAYLESPSGEKN